MRNQQHSRAIPREPKPNLTHIRDYRYHTLGNTQGPTLVLESRDYKELWGIQAENLNAARNLLEWFVVIRHLAIFLRDRRHMLKMVWQKRKLGGWMRWWQVRLRGSVLTWFVRGVYFWEKGFRTVQYRRFGRNKSRRGGREGKDVRRCLTAVMALCV